MKKYYGVFHVAEDGAATLCEVDGDVCYEAYARMTDAQASADLANAMAIEHKHASRYDVRPLPAGVRVYDRDSDDVVTTEAQQEKTMQTVTNTAARDLSVNQVTDQIKAFFKADQLTKAVTKARADIIAPLGKGTIAITPWQQDLFAAAFKGAEGIHKAVESNRATMRRMLLDQYGSKSPTYEQFKADRAALRILAEFKGLVDDQHVRKPYNAAVVELYGALPVSMSEAAIAKRAQRPTQPADKAAAKTAIEKALESARGAKPGETTERNPSAAETVEQFIAKFGLAKVLEATARILAEKRESKLDATTLQAVAKKYA